MMQDPGDFAPLDWTFASDVLILIASELRNIFPFTICPGGTSSLCTILSVSNICHIFGRGPVEGRQ
jgi:hypothetical protein